MHKAFITDLNRYSIRTLELLALLISGVDTRVIISSRAKHPLTVVLESRSIVLNPDQTSLYDVILGAMLMKYRAWRNNGPKSDFNKDRWLTHKARQKVKDDIWDSLEKKFRRIHELPGRYRPGTSLRGLQMTYNAIEWQPIEDFDPYLNGDRRHLIGAQSIDDFQITGAGDDFQWLESKLREGQLTLETVPSLEELPYLRVPLELTPSQRYTSTEEWESHVQDSENQSIVNDLMRCMKDKSVVRQDRLRAGRYKYAGSHLKSDRLVQARLFARIGRPFPIFRDTSSHIEPIFDPKEHLTVIAFDLNDFYELDWHGDRSAVLKFLAVILDLHKKMEVDTVIIGVADRIISLPYGKRVCIHFTTTLKKIEDSFDESLFNKLMLLMRNPPKLPGRSGCFHALMAEEITNQFYRHEVEYDHSFYTVFWWARRLVSYELSELRDHSFLERSAQRIDHLFRDLAKREGTLDTAAVYLPSDLCQKSEPGEFLNGVRILS